MSLVRELEHDALLLELDHGASGGASVEHAIVKLRAAHRLLTQARMHSLPSELCHLIDDFLLEELE